MKSTILLSCIALASLVLADVERDALKDLYQSTTGDKWGINAGWNGANSDCAWYGIECDDDGKVVQINLGENNLHGQLPDSIGNLTKLEQLELGGNQLYVGDLPSTMQNLKSLTYLSLYSTQIKGAIPDWLESLENLHYLDLSYNNLQGSIPDYFGNFNLHQLKLIQSSLSGDIPDSLSNCQNITVLNIGGNQFTGGIPDSFANLENLAEVDVSGNQLTGEFPKVIASWTNIRLLVLGSNQFTGAIPDYLMNFQNLHQIDVNDNQLDKMSASFKIPSVASCLFDKNPWGCPVSQWAHDQCVARCN